MAVTVPTRDTNTFGETQTQLVQQVVHLLPFPTPVPLTIFHALDVHMTKEGSVTSDASPLCTPWSLASDSRLHSMSSFISSLPPGTHDALTQDGPWPPPWVLADLPSFHLAWRHLFIDYLLYVSFLFHYCRLAWGSLISHISYYCKSLVNIYLHSWQRHQNYHSNIQLQASSYSEISPGSPWLSKVQTSWPGILGFPRNGSVWLTTFDLIP